MILIAELGDMGRYLSSPALGVVSRYMNNPGKEHWMTVKWILRYLRGTTN